MIKIFMCYMREIQGEPWETNLHLIRVKDKSKYFWKYKIVGIDAVIRCRSESWW